MSKPYPINTEFCCDVMTTALEGAIQYWGTPKGWDRDKDLRVLRFEIAERDPDDETEKPHWHVVIPEMIHEAIWRILHGDVKISPMIAFQFIGYPSNPDAGNVDAEGADCAVQVAVFGEIKYG